MKDSGQRKEKDTESELEFIQTEVFTRGSGLMIKRTESEDLLMKENTLKEFIKTIKFAKLVFINF